VGRPDPEEGVTAWSAVAWPEVAAAVAGGLVLCELDLLLTSAVLHRGLAHRAIAYPRGVARAVCVWAWLTEFARPLTFVASHRHHHRHSDTADDPHPPGLKGTWKVTLLSWYYVTSWMEANRPLAARRYLADFRDERLLQFLDRRAVTGVNFYGQLAVSLLHPVALGFLAGRLLPYMLLIGYMNAVGHTRGARRFDNLGTDARGFWQKLAGFLLAGEPLGHNYHHRFPTSATFRPGRLDPGHWFATRILRGVPARAPGAPRGAEWIAQGGRAALRRPC
jgi:stearoyl-CoA desaturase (delta-9 desaturase)